VPVAAEAVVAVVEPAGADLEGERSAPERLLGRELVDADVGGAVVGGGVRVAVSRAEVGVEAEPTGEVLDGGAEGGEGLGERAVERGAVVGGARAGGEAVDADLEAARDRRRQR